MDSKQTNGSPPLPHAGTGLDWDLLNSDQACQQPRGMMTSDDSRRALDLALAIERHCPCGARPESPNTHPHVLGCEVAELIQALGGECATVAGNYERAVTP